MELEKRLTALDPSVGADAGRSKHFCTDNSITEMTGNSKEFDDFQREMFRRMQPSYLETVSLSELYDNVYQRRPALVEGLLHRGAYLLVGAPKIGKSFLTAQLAYHVSTGTPLWGFPVKQGTVLHLALEDDYGRLQERLYRMYGVVENEKLRFSVSAKQLGKGLDEQLEGFVKEYKDTSLIIIDTLQKIREMAGDAYSYASDYQIITRLKNFADEHGICILVVHHTRRQRAEDSYDMISGTNGLFGAADGAILLQKVKRTANIATLEISGRDQQDQKLYLLRNEVSLCWELDHVETDLWKAPPEPLLDMIAGIITEVKPEWTGTPTELCELLKMNTKPNALSRKLNVNAGRLREEYGIQYWSRHVHGPRQIGFRYQGRDDVRR